MIGPAITAVCQRSDRPARSGGTACPRSSARRTSALWRPPPRRAGSASRRRRRRDRLPGRRRLVTGTVLDAPGRWTSPPRRWPA